MENVFGGFGVAGALIYIALIILWMLVPVFVFLISKRVKEMRDIARESRIEIKELNASLKYLKRKFNETNEQQT
ncbi:hypothetical protein PVT67_10020 [Gallaecimonas kandeliae]|uniref:hypothetical protein n=1 Tax=Gallaecimonas kandeliae TaxID=3029055 RepID=UPI0026470855|nr:hypothetical protein [Gallaecimonas kandeliae]WKE64036.1 hypothetical protein PVT67_10020 [Gallaecimonas kandeliae]